MGTFYESYVALCNSVNKSPSAVAQAVGLSKAAVNGWKTSKSNPTTATLNKLADYFGITVEDVLSANVDSIKNANFVDALDLLPKDEKTFLAFYRKMNPEEKKLATAMLSGIVNAKEK